MPHDDQLIPEVSAEGYVYFRICSKIFSIPDTSTPGEGLQGSKLRQISLKTKSWQLGQPSKMCSMKVPGTTGDYIGMQSHRIDQKFRTDIISIWPT